MFELSGVNYEEVLEQGDSILVRVIASSSYRGFELSGVRVIGGSSYRGFELSGVRVIGIILYFLQKHTQCLHYSYLFVYIYFSFNLMLSCDQTTNVSISLVEYSTGNIQTFVQSLMKRCIGSAKPHRTVFHFFARYYDVKEAIHQRIS